MGSPFAAPTGGACDSPSCQTPPCPGCLSTGNLLQQKTIALSTQSRKIMLNMLVLFGPTATTPTTTTTTTTGTRRRECLAARSLSVITRRVINPVLSSRLCGRPPQHLRPHAPLDLSAVTATTTVVQKWPHRSCSSTGWTLPTLLISQNNSRSPKSC